MGWDFLLFGCKSGGEVYIGSFLSCCETWFSSCRRGDIRRICMELPQGDPGDQLRLD